MRIDERRCQYPTFQQLVPKEEAVRNREGTKGQEVRFKIMKSFLIELCLCKSEIFFKRAVRRCMIFAHNLERRIKKKVNTCNASRGQMNSRKLTDVLSQTGSRRRPLLPLFPFSCFSALSLPTVTWTTFKPLSSIRTRISPSPRLSPRHACQSLS